MRRLVPLVCLLLPAACISLQQSKPLEVNVNVSGKLELVIHDARDDVARITGEKAKQVVSPQDIGLDDPATTGQATPPTGSTQAPVWASTRVVLLDAVGSEEGLKQAMAGRNKAVRALLDTKLAGEAHTGLLAARGTLSPAQQKLLSDENADRSALYTAEAKRKGVTEAEVSVAYYLARLGHAEPGDWYEKLNKASGQWEWKKWGQG